MRPTPQPPLTDTALLPRHTKESIMEMVLDDLHLGLVNMLVATALREGEITVLPVYLKDVPEALGTATMPGRLADRGFLSMQNGGLLPNFAGDLAATLPLLEEVRSKYPRFHYRIGAEVLTLDDTDVHGYRVEFAEPGTGAHDEQRVCFTLHGPDLPLLAAAAVLDYLLDQPNVLERVVFHTEVVPAVALAPEPEPTLQ